MLFGVGLADPVTLVSATVILAAVALLAGLLPAGQPRWTRWWR